MADSQNIREVVQLTRELSEVHLNPDDERSIVAAVRAKVASDRPGTPRRFLRQMLIVSGSLAAAVALSFGLLSALTPKPVSAAEALAACTQATEAFRGWVHLTPEGGAPFLMEVNQGIELKLKGIHFNTADGTSAVVYEFGGKPLEAIQPRPSWLFVQMICPGLKKQFLYTGLVDQLRILPTNQTWGSPVNLPLKLADVLAEIKTNGTDAPNVKESGDNNLERFDLSYGDPSSRLRPERIETVWVDPKTKLIRKVSTQHFTNAAKGPLVMEYTYGAPAIRDVYDLGVPHTATISEEVAATAH